MLGAFAYAANEGSTSDLELTELAGLDIGDGASCRAAHVIYDATAPGPTAGSTWTTPAHRRGIVVEIRATLR